jgi:hypothetical protein
VLEAAVRALERHSEGDEALGNAEVAEAARGALRRWREAAAAATGVMGAAG